MRPKSMILIVIALGCGLIASIGISQVIDAQNHQQPEKTPTEKIYVAVSEVDLGTLITPTLVKLEEWPKDKIPAGAVRTLEELEERRTLVRLFPGEPVMSAKLIEKDKYSDATQQIPPGFRVVSVAVDSAIAVSNLLKPGDNVDVVVFLKGGKNGIKKTTTRTILKSVKVFAVNTQIHREQDEDGDPIRAKNVSLLVKPDQVQKVMLAAELGKIRLSLRRSDEESDEDPNDTTVADLFGTDGGSEGKSAPAAVAPTSVAGGITDFLQGMKAAATEPTDTTNDGWEMTILTAAGQARVFRWEDRSKLPTEVRLEGNVTPAPAHEFPADAPPADLSTDSDDPTAEFDGDSAADWLDANPLKPVK